MMRLIKKDVEFNWGIEQGKAFSELKNKLCTAPVLLAPDYNKEFHLTSDASGVGIGAVLSQLDDNGCERPIAYYSRQLKGCERNYSTYDQELLALTAGLKHFRHYVEGNRVNLYTDHKALIFLNNQPKLTGRQARSVSFINMFNYKLNYKEGRQNLVADGLSR